MEFSRTWVRMACWLISCQHVPSLGCISSPLQATVGLLGVGRAYKLSAIYFSSAFFVKQLRYIVGHAGTRVATAWRPLGGETMIKIDQK